jgi:hypothetical protein
MIWYDIILYYICLDMCHHPGTQNIPKQSLKNAEKTYPKSLKTVERLAKSLKGTICRVLFVALLWKRWSTTLEAAGLFTVVSAAPAF